MKIKNWIGIGIIISLIFATVYGFSQEEITQLHDSTFKTHIRPPAQFAHDQHNDTAQIADCSTCHHVYEHGKKGEGESSEGQPCSQCHFNQDDNALELINIYHKQCRGCHLEKKAGPVLCGGCHQR
ncbi:MAG: cytochrome c3 family protein, partial [Desulfobacterales bacterium]|nr:cytochrome c3 family protein [Desulfobacterales bacterium]